MVLLLKILKDLLEVEYPKNTPSPPLASKFQRLSFSLLSTKYLKTYKREILGLIPLYNSQSVYF